MRKALIVLISLWLIAVPALASWDKGVAAFKRKDFQGAVKAFQKVVRGNPDGWRGEHEHDK